MQLTAEELADLVPALQPVAGGALSDERRRVGRVEVRLTLPILPVDGDKVGAPIEVMLRNISPRGMALLVDHEMPSGQQFVMQFSRKSGRPLVMLCMVMHSRRLPVKLFSVGCEFTCQLDKIPTNKEQEAWAHEAEGDTAPETTRIRQSVLR